MANKTMNFGVDLLPTTTSTFSLGSDEKKWNLYVDQINGAAPVKGVKGNAESSYRTGQVNLTAANIGLGNVDNTSDAEKQIYEANLLWGGKNFSASYGPIDAAMVSELGANRLMFTKGEAITVEYSRDGGSTWTDYGATDIQKTALFSSGESFLIGKADSTNKATANGTNYQLRVTINTGEANIYTELNKFVIYISTQGSSGCSVTIQKALQSSPNNFQNHTTEIPISGWPGYNVINVSSFRTYGKTPTSQYGRVRFLFKANGGDTNSIGLSIAKIMGFGGVGWNTPSTMAKTGHLYSFDAFQNAIFPAKVTATSFSGPLAGNVTGNVSGTASNVTGTVAVDHGGTGSATAAGARTNLGLGNVDNTADADKTVKYANMLTGFNSQSSNFTWGNQTGTAITVMNDSTGGSVGFRRDNPTSGKVSMVIDGTVYIREGAVNIGDAVKSFSVSGKTVTYTTLWGNTGTFTTQDTDTDTKNTAGSTNSTSKLYLIGATTQAANPTTNSYQYTYTNNGLLSALELGLNLNGTEKAHLEWNDTDKSIDFVFA